MIVSFWISFKKYLYIGGLYEINLDQRKLKTPGGKLFTVPNEALAIAVATEWDAQRDTLKFYTMHLVKHLTWSCSKVLVAPTLHKIMFKEKENLRGVL